MKRKVSKVRKTTMEEQQQNNINVGPQNNQNGVELLWNKLKMYRSRFPISFQRNQTQNILGDFNHSQRVSPGKIFQSNVRAAEKKQKLVEKENSFFKVESLNRALQFQGYKITPPKQSQDQIMTNYLEIFRPQEERVIGYSNFGAKSIELTVKEQIRKEIVENSRKLSIEVYEKDIVELLVLTQKRQSAKGKKPQISEYQYVYYKVHRDVIIWAIACSTYSYGNAQEIIQKSMIAYDEEVFAIFGQYKLPKALTNTYWRKLSNLNKKIKQILEQENKKGLILPMLNKKKSKKGDEINIKSEVNMKQIAEDCLILHNEDNKMRASMRKIQLLEEKTEFMREDTNRLKRALNYKCMSLYFFLFLNALILVYLVYQYS